MTDKGITITENTQGTERTFVSMPNIRLVLGIRSNMDLPVTCFFSVSSVLSVVH